LEQDTEALVDVTRLRLAESPKAVEKIGLKSYWDTVIQASIGCHRRKFVGSFLEETLMGSIDHCY
jgi:hypothetical protein